MVATTSDIVPILLSLVWAASNVSCWINPRFRVVLSSEARLSELFRLANFTFCPDLFAILRGAEPPSIEWFLSLTTFVPKNVWGIYAIVLKKQNHRDLLYIGSATASKRGVRSRFGEYNSKKHLGKNVREALRNGYTIRHKALLAWCPIPRASKIPTYRTVVIALEAVFACYFWAMARCDHDYGFNHLCPWPLDSFTYNGTCSHNPFKEAIPGDIKLSEEELEQIADKTKAKAIAYGREYHRQQRLEASPEFKAAQARANKKARPKTKQNQQEARANKTFYCALCDHAAGDNSHLTDHKKTKGHQRRVKEAAN
jgi:hypothetical protein